MLINSISSVSIFKGNQKAKRNIQQAQQKINAPTKQMQDPIKALNSLEAIGANNAVAIKSSTTNKTQPIKKQTNSTSKHIQELYNFYESANKTAESLIANAEKQKNETAKNAQRLYDEVMGVYERNKNNSNNPSVKITQNSDNNTIMEELDKNGKVKRRTTFYLHGGSISIKENSKKFPNGSERIGKELYTKRQDNKDKLDFYLENIFWHPSGKMSYDRKLNFSTGSYEENGGVFYDTLPKTNIIYETICNQPCVYKENDAQNQQTIRSIKFSDGKLDEYSEIEITDPKKPPITKTVTFAPTLTHPNLDEGEISVTMQYENSHKDWIVHTRELILKNGKPIKYTEGYESDYDYTTVKEYQMTKNGWKKITE